MPTNYVTKTGDVLDRIVWRHHGEPSWPRLKGLVEAALAANPHLRDQPMVLSRGLTITLPDAPTEGLPQPTVKLWD
jgi:phage tail protein X